MSTCQKIKTATVLMTVKETIIKCSPRSIIPNVSTRTQELLLNAAQAIISNISNNSNGIKTSRYFLNYLQ